MLHVLGAGVQKSSVFFIFNVFRQLFQPQSRITDDSRIDGIALPDFCRIRIKLNGRRIIREIIPVRERCAEHDQQIAFLHCFVGGLCADLPEIPEKVGMAVRHDAFCRKGDHNRSGRFIGECEQLLFADFNPWPARMTGFFALLIYCAHVTRCSFSALYQL